MVVSKFDENGIHASIMQGQIQWHSGYIQGRSEMKKETLRNLDSLIIDIRKRNDETVLNEYMKVKRMIESL